MLFTGFIVFASFGQFGAVLGTLISGFAACEGLYGLQGLECLKGVT